MTADAPTLESLFRVLDLTGVAANAVLGGVIARRERLDPVGFAVLAVLSGLGGGLLRDTLLQQGPPVAFTDGAYLLVALGAAVASYVVHVQGRTWDRVWPVVDALALGCWAATGAQRTLDAGLGWLPAILLGTITAVGGGAIRDVVMRRVPGVLGGNTLYATCAAAAAAVLVVGYRSGAPAVGSIGALVTGAGLCLLARRRGWMLPEADAWARRVVPARYRFRRRSGMTQTPADRDTERDDERDTERVEGRADLLPEEKAAGSADPRAQAEAVLAESDERVDGSGGSGDGPTSTSE